jgi:hypothetical protein
LAAAGIAFLQRRTQAMRPSLEGWMPIDEMQKLFNSIGSGASSSSPKVACRESDDLHD